MLATTDFADVEMYGVHLRCQRGTYIDIIPAKKKPIERISNS